MNSEHIVILLHGIRDHGLWEDEVAISLRNHGLTPKPIIFGRFDLFRFLFPFSFFRKRVIAKVKRQLEVVQHDNPEAKISIIAHSFGTWVVTKIIEDNFLLKFNRLIFCGSVADANFKSENYSGYFNHPVLNEIGDKDIWPALAKSITWGYGTAGVEGFSSARATNRRHAGYKHGDFLKKAFCDDHWISFLKGNPENPLSGNPKTPPWYVNFILLFHLKYLIIFSIIFLSYLTGYSDRASWHIKNFLYDEETTLKIENSGKSPINRTNGVIDFNSTKIPYRLEIFNNGVLALEFGKAKRWLKFGSETQSSIAFLDHFFSTAIAQGNTDPLIEKLENDTIFRIEIVDDCLFLCRKLGGTTIELDQDNNFVRIDRDKNGIERSPIVTGKAESISDLLNGIQIDDLNVLTTAKSRSQKRLQEYARKFEKSGDDVLVFINSTVFGSWRNGVAVMNDGVYIRSGLGYKPKMISFSELRDTTLSTGRTSYYFNVNDERYSIAGSAVTAKQLVPILNLIRSFEKNCKRINFKRPKNQNNSSSKTLFFMEYIETPNLRNHGLNIHSSKIALRCLLAA